MKRRETINSNAEKFAAVAYEEAGKIRVEKYETEVLAYSLGEREWLEFDTIADYEAWKSAQDWIKPEKVRRVAFFAKVPKDNTTPQARYDAANTRKVTFKFNTGTDADILAKLDGVNNKQGYIKQLIREDLKK